MRIQVLTIFPELFGPFLATSLVGRAVARGLMCVEVRDLRDFTADRHRSVDDEPYGGGGGMVMTAPPWIRAVRTLAAASPDRAAAAGGWAGDEPAGDGAHGALASAGAPAGEQSPGQAASGGAAGGRRPPGQLAGECAAGAAWRVLLSPQGVPLDDAKVRQLAGRGRLLLMCGRYEGIDERVRLSVVDEEISIGDYVLSGGELPAMVLIEALSRQIPGVVGLADSVVADSFRQGLLDHPHYTRPPRVEGMEVPPVLLSGDHAAIARWRHEQALAATRAKRPDLLAKGR